MIFYVNPKNDFHCHTEMFFTHHLCWPHQVVT